MTLMQIREITVDVREIEKKGEAAKEDNIPVVCLRQLKWKYNDLFN